MRSCVPRRLLGFFLPLFLPLLAVVARLLPQSASLGASAPLSHGEMVPPIGEKAPPPAESSMSSNSPRRDSTSVNECCIFNGIVGSRLLASMWVDPRAHRLLYER